MSRNVFKKILALISISVFLTASAFAQKPTLFFADLTSGPSTGGETGNGALVTVYGNNLGTSPSVFVGSTAGIIKAAPSPYFWYQKIVLQIPSSVAQGATTISVSNSNGTSNTLPFTVRAGRIFIVTSAAQLKAVRTTWAAGDIYYAQGTWAVTGDDGFGWRASFSIDGLNNVASGTASSPIAIVGYPGSSVTIGPGADFGIRQGDGIGYITVAGLNLRAGLVASQVGGSGLRYVANDISSPNSNTQAGCFSSNVVSDIKFLGNNVHNCGSSSSNKQDHSVYFSTDVNHVEEAWNSIHDNQSCYGTQFHSSPLGTGTGNNQYDLHVHDNQFYNQTCSAVNFATIDPSKGTVEFYNNLVYNSGTGIAPDGSGGAAGCLYFAGITNTGSAGSGSAQVYNNTFYKCGPAFLTDYDGSHPVVFTNNIVQLTTGSYSTLLNGGSFSGSKNLWFGAGSAPTQTSGNISVDAKFLNAAGANFHLVTGSPAIGAGSANSLIYDIEGTPRAVGSAIDLGAYAASAATSNPTPDLTVSLSHTGNFTAGDTGKTYTITVTNSGSASTNLAVTVTESLPAGLTATAIGGTGWSCVVGTLTCTRSDALAAGSGYPAITLTVNVAASASGTLTNAVSVGGGGETNTSNDSASDPTIINTPVDLTIAKSHTGSFLQGQTGATYSITVTNSGGTATSGTVTLVDTLPTGLTATAIAGTGWSCTLATLTCARSDALAANSSYAAVTVTVNVASNAAASVTNTASVSGGGDSNTANNNASDATTVLTPADLTLAKTHTGNFTQGQTGATYAITVTNSGGGATSGTVIVSDTLPTGLTATAMSGTGWTCTLATLTCNRTTALAAGASYPAITLTVNVAANAAATVTNTATVSGGGENNTSNDSASDATTINASAAPADLTITKTHTGNFTQGQTGAAYTLTATNGGGSPTSGAVTVVDTLPSGLTATAMSGTGWSCTLATLTCTRTTALAAAASYPAITLTVNVAANAAATVTNTATVSGGGETNTSNDSASDATTVNASASPADLTITKTHTGNFTQGQTGAAYTLTATNGGGSPTSGAVTVVDTLPSGLTATAMSGTGWSCTLATLTCTRSDALAPAANYPAITLTVNVAANAAASVTNIASVSGGGETNTSNDSANDPTTISASAPPADLTIAKTHTGNFTQGQTGATYAITVTNGGSSATSGIVTVVDTLPTGLTASGLSGTGWSCVLASATCTRSTALAPASSYPAITLTVNVAANAPASVTNVATVSGGGEQNTSNDTASDATTISVLAPPPDLTVAKSHSGNFTQGQIGAAYSISVSNSGGSQTIGTVTLSDTLPAGLTATAIAGTGWSCTLATLTCTRADALAAAASYPVVTVTVNVSASAASSVTNVATVSGGGEQNTSNNGASDPTTINVAALPADLTVTKTHSGNFTQGQSGATYSISVTNGGGSATSGTVTVADTLPSGLTAGSIGGTGWSCTLASLTCTRNDALAAGASYSAITVAVNVAANAAASVTNTATVSGGGEQNTGNNSASDPTTINSAGAPTDLTVASSHSGTFAQGQIGAIYTITVSNIGGTASFGPVTVTDSLPAGLTATGIAGTGWICTPATLSCARSDALAAGASYPVVTVTMIVAANAPASVVNGAAVSGGGDAVAGNNFASDVTTITSTGGSGGGSGSGTSGGGSGSGGSVGSTTVSTSAVDFSASTNGTPPAPQTITVNADPSSSWVASISSITGGNWLSLSPVNGSGVGTITAAVTGPALDPGTYDATIQIYTFLLTPGSISIPTYVTVSYTVNAKQDILLSANLLTFSMNPGSNPSSQQIAVSGSATDIGWSATATTDTGNWLTISPSSGTAPSTLTASVNGSGLAQGTYNGRITFTIGGSSDTKLVSVQLLVGPPQVNNGGIVNAASYSGDGSVSPGAIMSLFGLNLTTGTAAVASAPVVTALAPEREAKSDERAAGIAPAAVGLPGTLQGTQVLVNGLPSPLFYVSRSQVNFQVPYEIAGSIAQIEVVSGGIRSTPVRVSLSPSAIGIFTTDSSGKGQGSVLNQDYAQNSSSNPAQAGSVISVYLTGLGSVSPALPSGQPGSSGPNLNMTLTKPSVSIGDVNAEVLFSGVAPGFVGLYQVNVRIPDGITGSNAVPLMITADGKSSNQVTIAVR